jgi:protein ImuB
MKRITALWFPLFATDRRTRPGGDLESCRDRPLVLVARSRDRLRIAAANAAAIRAGLAAGMAEADARALCPGLVAAPAESGDDRKDLAALAAWCRRWSPWSVPFGEDGEYGVSLDVTGCAHLFGGERAMLDDMMRRLSARGLAVRAGLADTPAAARAVARFGDDPATIVPEGAGRQILAALPIAALRLPAEATAALRRLGLMRIADLAALPRGPLAARFGRAVPLALDRLFGHAPEPLSPLPPDAHLTVRLAFTDTVARDEDVTAATRILLTRLHALLERRGLGALRLRLDLVRVDGVTLTRTIGTARPVRDPDRLARLFAEDRTPLDAGFGIERIALTATAAEPLEPRQSDLETRDRDADSLPPLLDRLALRLGEGAVFRPVPAPTHLPERLCLKAPPQDPVPRPDAWPRRRRPVRLWRRPEPVGIEAETGTPVRLLRRGEAPVAIRAEGPERIAAEWWRGAAPPPPGARRDYWRIEDRRGRRWWLFRDGNGHWFLHGGFA